MVERAQPGEPDAPAGALGLPWGHGSWSRLGPGKPLKCTATPQPGCTSESLEFLVEGPVPGPHWESEQLERALGSQVYTARVV